VNDHFVKDGQGETLRRRATADVLPSSWCNVFDYFLLASSVLPCHCLWLFVESFLHYPRSSSFTYPYFSNIDFYSSLCYLPCTMRVSTRLVHTTWNSSSPYAGQEHQRCFVLGSTSALLVPALVKFRRGPAFRKALKLVDLQGPRSQLCPPDSQAFMGAQVGC